MDTAFAMIAAASAGRSRADDVYVSSNGKAREFLVWTQPGEVLARSKLRTGASSPTFVAVE